MIHLVLSVNHIMRIPLDHQVSLLKNVANQESICFGVKTGILSKVLHTCSWLGHRKKETLARKDLQAFTGGVR